MCSLLLGLGGSLPLDPSEILKMPMAIALFIGYTLWVSQPWALEEHTVEGETYLGGTTSKRQTELGTRHGGL